MIETSPKTFALRYNINWMLTLVYSALFIAKASVQLRCAGRTISSKNQRTNLSQDIRAFMRLNGFVHILIWIITA